MKILQINNFHYLRGGSDKMYLETSRLLEANNHEVIYFSSQNKENVISEYESYFVKPMDLYHSSSMFDKIDKTLRFIYNSEAEKKLKALIELKKPDIAHLHIFQSRLSSAVLNVLKKCNIPVVMSVHEYKLLCPVYTLLDGNKKICEKCKGGKVIHCAINKCNKGSAAYSLLSSGESYFRNMFFPFNRYIDKFIMVSNFINEKHVEFYPEIKKQSVVLYNFIDSDETNIVSNKSGYLYFGRLSREKGIMTTLEAFKKFPHLNLKIAGDGDLKDTILNYIREHNLSNVTMLGFLKGEALKKVISDAKMVIVPSEWYEPFGLTIIESFLGGTPVIGSDAGAIPELIEDGKSGFIFNCGNADSLEKAIDKAELLSDEEYWNMSAEGKYFAKAGFNKKDYYEKLISIYKEVLHKRKILNKKGDIKIDKVLHER